MCFLLTLTHEKALYCLQETGAKGRMENEEWVIRGLGLILQMWTSVLTRQRKKKEIEQFIVTKITGVVTVTEKYCIHIKQSKNSKTS